MRAGAKVWEKRLLQCAVTLACLVPIMAGLGGVIGGVWFPGGHSPDLDSHFRYLSGLLLGIGLGFLSTIPSIEKHTARFRLLTFIVVTGGMARLLGVILIGLPGYGMRAALAMELVVTPLLCLWQHRVAQRRPGPGQDTG